MDKITHHRVTLLFLFHDSHLFPYSTVLETWNKRLHFLLLPMFHQEPTLASINCISADVSKVPSIENFDTQFTVFFIRMMFLS